MTSSGPQPSAPLSANGPCPRPGCPGRLVDGVCPTCGLRLKPAPAQQPQPPQPQQSQPPQPQPQQGQAPQGQPQQGQAPQPNRGQWPAQPPQPTGSRPYPPSGSFPAQPRPAQNPAPNPQSRPFPARNPQSQPFPAQQLPTGSRPMPPQGAQQAQPPARPQPAAPSEPVDPALSAPAPTSVVASPYVEGAKATPHAWAPPGQPLRAMPGLAAQRPRHAAPDAKQADKAAEGETVRDIDPVERPFESDGNALSARLSGWEPAPDKPKKKEPEPTKAEPPPTQAAQRRPDTAAQMALGAATQLSGPSQYTGAPSDSRPLTSSRGSGRGSRPSRGRTRSQSRRIGGGLVEVPRVPYKDPASAVMANAEVPEDKRYCGNCNSPVGRAANGKPGSPDGVCAKCGTSFSFRPKLVGGDLVGGQYEVLGALAHGGLGWIYLARDHNVNGRWVVLKGLIDTGDTAAMAAAVAEKQFLSQVEHANIVKIYNFVQHPDPQTGTLVGYIVMEYIGGESLRQIALANKDNDGRVIPLPLARVLAYGLEVLPALGYLHSVGLLYCDLKPDNVIQTDAQLKLIDLGAVRHVDDMQSPIFFTSGYSAPEIASEGPSVASDIYTVGRTLAVLSFDFVGYTSTYMHSLPPIRQVPLFSLFGSYHRLLARATHLDPDRRFDSAEDMADQLTGVLREVLALGTREPRPGRSAVFGPEVRTFGENLATSSHTQGAPPAPPDWAEVVNCLPTPQVDTDDPAAGLVSGLAALAGDAPRELLDALRNAPANSMEARLWRTRALLELGELNQANKELHEAAVLDARGAPVPELPYDWRISWFRGLLGLMARRPRDARTAFEHVYDMVPGELAPKLALAVSAELCGDYFPAARLYELVWRTDRSFVSAAFGLARVYLAQGDRSGALDVLESVPDRSSHYLAAQLAVIATRTKWTPAAKIAERDLVDAGNRLTRLSIDPQRRAGLTADVLTAAHQWVRAGGPNGSPPAERPVVLGCELAERDLRFGLENCYRSMARLAATPEERIGLVDQANAIRPRTLT
jgi:serine/threonine-protein kinase PknG